MKQSITLNQFIEQFKAMGRDYYTYEAYETLYNFLEEVYDGDYELDVISLCCEFSQDALSDVLASYGLQDFNELNDYTLAFELSNDEVLYQSF
ncbi:MAG: hypothetical protein GY920_20155 [Aliivibrio sp.]|nr:hypothetical protein [Aliivibrio sp.]MCP4322151.1 hypothetical protein [Alteromonadales bacterium]